MNFKEYTEKAKTTAIYKDDKALLACTALGVGSELNEWFDHKRGNSRQRIITMELGDVCWKIALLSDFIQVELEPNLTSRYYNLETDGHSSVGEIQEIIKKAIRNNDWIISEVNRDKLRILLSELLYGIQIQCTIYSINFSDLLQSNIEKLASRRERGVLGGSGDLR
ncbi:hypothetical protein KAR91_45535 [Candidatus Pacearchaeota archaeon]|nr:hypothetical protein [Candidatus Pacearchaeota archaeon]